MLGIRVGLNFFAYDWAVLVQNRYLKYLVGCTLPNKIILTVHIWKKTPLQFYSLFLTFYGIFAKSFLTRNYNFPTDQTNQIFTNLSLKHDLNPSRYAPFISNIIS